MQVKNIFGSRRHVLTRMIVTSALLGSTFLVGLATTASAAGPYHLVVQTQPSPAAQSGTALAVQPSVAIEDSTNAVVTGFTNSMTATITTGGVSVSGGTATEVAGVATFSGLTLNALAGTYTLTFTDATNSATGVSNNVVVSAGAAKQLKLSTPLIAGAISGVALNPQPVVNVEDSGGNIVTSDTSTVSAAYSVVGSTVINNTKSAVAGVATFAGFTITAPIDTSTGTLTFSDGSLTPISLTSVAITGPATKLAVITQPSVTGTSGTALVVQPVVSVEDAAGQVVKGDTSTVTAAIVSAPAGSSVTSPTKAAVAGVATFSGLALNALAGPYTLTFSDGALTPVVSSSITLGAGAASQLVVVTHPSASAATGLVLAQQPVVKVEDSGGNVLTTVTTGAVTASILTGTGGTLSGGTTANFAAGVATFSGLILTGVPGSSYTLKYSGDSVSANDTTVIIVGQPQTTLVVTSVNATYGRTYALHTSGGSGTGATTYVAANGTASGCSLSGATLKSSSTGTCIVTATKVADSTYATTTSVAATVTFAKLPIPHAVRVNYSVNKAALSLAARNTIIALSRKLTTHSTVLVTGYAKGNLRLARSRAIVAAHFLVRRVHVRIHYRYITRSATQSALLRTLGQ